MGVAPRTAGSSSGDISSGDIIVKAEFDVGAPGSGSGIVTGCKKYWVLLGGSYPNLIKISVDKGTLSEAKFFGWIRYQELSNVSQADTVTISAAFTHYEGGPKVCVLGIGKDT